MFRKELATWAIPYLQRKPNLTASKLALILGGGKGSEWERFVQALSAEDTAAIGKAVSKDHPPVNVRKHLSAIVRLFKGIAISRKDQG